MRGELSIDQHGVVDALSTFSANNRERVQAKLREIKYPSIPLRVCSFRKKLEACFEHLDGKESNILGQSAFLGDLEAVCKVRQRRWETDLGFRGVKLASDSLLSHGFLRVRKFIQDQRC